MERDRNEIHRGCVRLKLLTQLFLTLICLKGEIDLSKKKKKKLDFLDIYNLHKSIRKDWGNIKPVTKVIPDKKKYKRKSKHKERGFED